MPSRPNTLSPAGSPYGWCANESQQQIIVSVFIDFVSGYYIGSPSCITV